MADSVDMQRLLRGFTRLAAHAEAAVVARAPDHTDKLVEAATMLGMVLQASDDLPIAERKMHTFEINLAKARLAAIKRF